MLITPVVASVSASVFVLRYTFMTGQLAEDMQKLCIRNQNGSDIGAYLMRTQLVVAVMPTRILGYALAVR